MSIKDKFPAIKPSLNLDFANTKRLDPRITFSRASTGTYYDGVTHAKAEENLLLYSQEFDNAYWDDSNVTVTANDTTAPDGTTTAEKIAVPGSSSAQYIFKNSVFTQTSTGYALSIYAKAGTLSYFFLAYRGNLSNVAIAEWDLSTGTLNASNASGTAVIDSTSITSVGSGWYRLVLNVTTSTGNSDARFAFGPTDGTFNNFGYYDGSTAGDAYAWGAQLEQRSSVTAYTATTDQPITNYIPVLQSAAAGEARFDHDPLTGESKGLLIEEQRTNLVTYSEDFSDSDWTKAGATITSNTIVSPDGTLTGDKLVEDSGNNAHQAFQSVTAATSAHTVSFYVKAAERSHCAVKLYINGGAARYTVVFDLDAISVTDTEQTGTPTNTDSSILDAGNGWRKCSVTADTQGTTLAQVQVSNSGTPTYNGTADVVYTGDGYSGIFIWGAQLEAGAFPTSYIKTTSAQATRNADSASMTGTNFSEWYRQDEGTVYAEYENTQNEKTAFIWSLEDGTDDERIYALQRVNQAGSFSVTDSGVDQVDITSGSGSLSQPLKIASAYKINDFAHYLSGSQVGTDSSGTIPNVNSLDIGLSSATPDFPRSGHIKRLTYYPARLTNAQLQALTEG